MYAVRDGNHQHVVHVGELPQGVIALTIFKSQEAAERYITQSGESKLPVRPLPTKEDVEKAMRMQVQMPIVVDYEPGQEKPFMTNRQGLLDNVG